MIALSTRRPIFLSRAQQNKMLARRLIAAALLTIPAAFLCGYFFGG